MTAEQLVEKSFDFENLREHLRLRGREAYLQKRVGWHSFGRSLIVEDLEHTEGLNCSITAS